MGVQTAAVDFSCVVPDFGGVALFAGDVEVDVAAVGIDAAAAHFGLVAEDLAVDDADFAFMQVDAAAAARNHLRNALRGAALFGFVVLDQDAAHTDVVIFAAGITFAEDAAAAAIGGFVVGDFHAIGVIAVK